jgi:hypothetical protein
VKKWRNEIIAPDYFSKTYFHWIENFVIGVFQDKFGMATEYLFGIKVKKFIVVQKHPKARIGNKMKIHWILGSLLPCGLSLLWAGQRKLWT